MRTKLKLLGVLMLLIATAFTASAYDFEVDGIYYNKTSDTEVEVTYGDSYSGSVTIRTSVTYGDTTYSVTSIGNSAFRSCRGLTSVTIPNSVTSIGNYAFEYCSGLTSVTIPNSVTSIGRGAFNGCIGLTAVHITDLAAWCKIEFGGYDANPLCCAGNLYLNGEKVTNLTIPNSVTSIGDYAFYGCSGLTSVTIPNSVTSIGRSAFSGCSGLTSVTIPNSVTYIGSGAFNGCENISTIYSYADTPPTIYGNTFVDSIYAVATLYVPNGCVDVYKSASIWDSFYNIIEGNYNGVDDVIADEASAEVVGYYNLQGISSDEPWEGLNIVVYRDGTTRKIKY